MKKIKAAMHYHSVSKQKLMDSPTKSASKPRLNSKGTERGSLLQSFQKPLSALNDNKIVRNHIEPK